MQSCSLTQTQEHKTEQVKDHTTTLHLQLSFVSGLTEAVQVLVLATAQRT